MGCRKYHIFVLTALVYVIRTEIPDIESNIYTPHVWLS